MEQLARRAVDDADDHRDHDAGQDAQQQAARGVADQHQQRAVKAHLLADADVHVPQGVDEHRADRHQGGYDHVADQRGKLVPAPDALALHPRADRKEDDAEDQAAQGRDGGAMLFDPLEQALLFSFLRNCCHSGLLKSCIQSGRSASARGCARPRGLLQSPS